MKTTGLLFLLIFTLVLSSQAQTTDDEIDQNVFWDSVFVSDGLNGYIKSLAVTGDTIYLSGYFTMVRGLLVNHVAKTVWDGKNWQWSTVGNDGGFDYSQGAKKIVVYKNEVYFLVGEPFTIGRLFVNSGIAKWNGIQWEEVTIDNTILPTYIEDMRILNDELIINGEFSSHLTGQAVFGILRLQNYEFVKYNIATSNIIERVNKVVGNKNSLYIYSDNRILKKNELQWNEIAQNIEVNDMLLLDDDLIIAGQFEKIGNKTVNHIARYKAGVWQAMGSGLEKPATHIETVKNLNNESHILAIGDFTWAKGVSEINVWNNNKWESYGGVDDEIYCTYVKDNIVYIGGKFQEAYNSDADNIVIFNYNEEKHWQQIIYKTDLFNTFNDKVFTLAKHGNYIYIGGSFTAVGNIDAAGIAKWDGYKWYGLSSGINGTVTGIAPTEQFIYVWGNFTTAGGDKIDNNIACWDNYSFHWKKLDLDVDKVSNVKVITEADNQETIYIAGYTIEEGSKQQAVLYKGDGSQWTKQSLPAESSSVSRIAVDNEENIYFIGRFKTTKKKK